MRRAWVAIAWALVVVTFAVMSAAPAAARTSVPTIAGGVCDYSKPGVGQHGAVAWLTYQDRRGHVIFGGRPLGPVPVSHRVR